MVMTKLLAPTALPGESARTSKSVFAWGPVQGGALVPLTSNLARKPSVSPDGKFVACEYWRQEAQKWVVALLDAKTGAAVRFFPEIPAGTGVRLRWELPRHWGKRERMRLA